jgi:predicted DNA-binding ribbon-helix-helix protein
MKSPVVKRSIVGDMTLSELVGEIDGNRQQGNLSSAIRLFVLDYFRTRAMAAAPDVKPQSSSPAQT